MEEQVTKQPRRRILIWIIGILAAVAVLAVGAYVVVFHVNQFSLAVNMEGQPDMLLEYGEEYTDPGASVMLYGTLFWKDGVTPKDAAVHVENNIDQNVLGKYTVTYTAQLHKWNASAQRTIRVVDSVSPVITLTQSEEPLMAGTPYEEEGFTAVDNYDGDITDRVVRKESYGLVTYTVVDSSGNPAHVEREIPYYDPLPPEIVLTEGEHMTIPAGAIFADPGFTATDNVDGDMTDLVEVSGEVLWYQPGSYELVYSVTDSYENQGTVTRRVDVEAQPRPEVKWPQKKVIYLTFDDGPGPYTEALLDVLEKYNVKATFFVVDTGYDSVMKKIVEKGHSIGIHSVSHNYQEIYASPEAYFTDLYRMQNIIYKNTGVKTTLVRFPGGGSNTISCFNEGIMTTLTEAVQDAGFQYFDWNVDSKDAGGATKTNQVVQNVTEAVSQKQVAVVLQHDIHAYSVEAVEDIIIWALENGYTFLPLQSDSPNAHHNVIN